MRKPTEALPCQITEATDLDKADLKELFLSGKGCTAVVGKAAQLGACATISLSKVGLTPPPNYLCFSAVLSHCRTIFIRNQSFSSLSYPVPLRLLLRL